MKKKLMTLQQHRLLKEAGQLIAFSERLKHAQKETTDRNWKEREEQRRRTTLCRLHPRGQARVEHFLHRSPCRRYSLLGQGLEPIRLFHLHPCLPSLPALHGRTA